MIYGGLLLIAAALCLVGYNLCDEQRAAESVAELAQEIEMKTGVMDTEQNDEDVSEQPETPAYLLDSTMDMPTAELDGNDYIGTLAIPSLGLSLPVMGDWSYPKLKLAPCRYTGSVYQDDLIIAGHNYCQHFGRLKELTVGDVVLFTDMAGNLFSYTVSQMEQLPATAVEEMVAGDWDLTLFTCTMSGKARVTVRCERTNTD